VWTLKDDKGLPPRSEVPPLGIGASDVGKEDAVFAPFLPPEHRKMCGKRGSAVVSDERGEAVAQHETSQLEFVLNVKCGGNVHD
jgi:hypothetical protein